MKSKKPIFFVIFILALMMMYTAVFGVSFGGINIKGAPDMRFGIDIRGGVDAAFEPVGLDRKPTSQELESARSIINTRLDQQNILDRDVTIDKDNGFIIVRFPWKADETDFNPEQAMAELGETAQLTFTDDEGNILLEGSHVKNSSAGFDRQRNTYVVSLSFNEEGTKLFSKATKKLIGKPIHIFMDDVLIQSATVQEQISTGDAQISGMNGYEDAKDISNKINSGALPFSMTTKNHSTISPTLGAGALDVMVQAGILAFIVICIFLIFYYRIPGIVASVALLIQVAGQILALSIPQMTLTLTGIAGVILSIGMGVDANVIISERISEEVKSGKSVRSAILSGFKGAFTSVFDGNITVLIVGIILMSFGSGSLLSFAYSLLTGIFFNFVAGVTASRLMIWSLSEFKCLRKPSFYTCFSKRITAEDKYTRFFQKRKIFFVISLVIMLFGIISVFTKGVQLDIQFKGGALLKYTYEGEIDADAVADKTTSMLGRPVSTQITSDLATEEKKLIINIAGNYGLDVGLQGELDSMLKEEFPESKLNLSESSMVEPFFGQKFLTNGIIAIVLSAALVMIYVWIRFSKMGGLSAGAMALVALFHDLLVVFFTCVIFQIPIGDSFVAVALSIIGYSINDTIVIYDRIRENTQMEGNLSIEEVTDLSISQSITRSIVTNVAVLISVSMVYVLAFTNSIDSIQSFALPMAIGSISGCYSTICIAGPFWVSWKKHKEKKGTLETV